VRRVIAKVALTFGLLGCAVMPADTPVPYGLTTDVIGPGTCGVDTYLAGPLVLFSGSRSSGSITPNTGLAIQDDQYGIVPMIWHTGIGARQLPGGEVEVLDSVGTVLATTGHRYKIGGTGFPDQPWRLGKLFWVCGEVVPQ